MPCKSQSVIIKRVAEIKYNIKSLHCADVE